ncbi:hypothetical protein SEA_PLUMBUS_82 [Mycobacterium phage Plumbus]|uniref:Uncharacterized protein n=1 Tax=Mycobacterium phage Plumbus TaxID=2790994 RepID=A0A7T3N3P4_9CAUD|nr:hypothetical protein KNV67_gp082 [Mycobacterium phage Plumbus]QPX62779.1 hypothetical protein SEA_PLUMBUS_82 [Mycobacterium phage Plumbus]
MADLGVTREESRRLARAYYDAWVWSGCDGSRRDRLSEEARSDWARQARRWLFVIRATGEEA